MPQIFAYIQRVAPLSDEARHWSPERNGKQIWELVFSPRMGWGPRSVPMDQPINILSAGRPRWSAQLCRLAGQEAFRNNRRVIVGGDIVLTMPEFGRLRLDDLYREHSHQFPLLQGLVESFAGGATRYTTAELMDSIQHRFLARVIKESGYPSLEGRQCTGPLELGRFLYKVGFIYGRDDEFRGALSFIRYEDRSDLLSNEINLDDGLVWEVHPSYRNTLRMRGFGDDGPRAQGRARRNFRR